MGKQVKSSKRVLKDRKKNEKARKQVRKSIKRVGADSKSRKRWGDWRESDGIEYPVKVMKLSDLEAGGQSPVAGSGKQPKGR